MKRFSLSCDGVDRDYLLAAPPAPVGLVVVLHGRGGTAEWADGETGWSALAGRHNFALALPEGTPLNPRQPPRFLSNPPYWNDGSESEPTSGKTPAAADSVHSPHRVPLSSHDPSPAPIAPQDDVAFLTAVIDDVAKRLNKALPAVFMTGFSNGAGMTFRFASECATRVTAIAPVAGHCWVEGPRPARPVPTLYAVGTVDPLIPLRGGDVPSPWTGRLVRRPPVGRTLERWARAIGCEPVPVPLADEGGVRTDRYPGPVTFQCVTVEGLGHHWPGGKGQLNPRLAGPPASAFNATEQIWAFFKQFV